MRGRTVLAFAVTAVLAVVLYGLGGLFLSWFAETLGATNKPQWWFLLFKTAIVGGFAFLAYVFIYLPLKWLERKWPEGKLKRLLFTDHILFSGRSANRGDGPGAR